MSLREVAVEHPTKTGYVQRVGGVADDVVLNVVELHLEDATGTIRTGFLSYETGSALASGEKVLGGELHLATGALVEAGSPIKIWRIEGGPDILDDPLTDTAVDDFTGTILDQFTPTQFTSFIIPLDESVISKVGTTDFAIFDVTISSGGESYTLPIDLSNSSLVLFVRPRGTIISNLNK